MRPVALPVLVLSLVGCTGATLPPPTVVSVSPPERPASSAGPVTVTLDAILPTLVDHGAGTAMVDDRLTLKIGPHALGTGHWADAGVVTDFLASILPQGSYDVTVQLGDGREAIAADAFRVTPGDWPVGYTVDTIPNQTSGVPFAVTIRARGAPDGGYGGTVNLSVPGAQVSPGITGAFDGGVRVEVITVSGDAGDYQLLVQDLVGHLGMSLPFHVR